MKPETKRAAVTRLYQAGVPPAEVAAQLGISLNSVYSTASHARDKGCLPAACTRMRRSKHTAGMKLLQYRCRKAEDVKSVGSMAEVANGLTPATLKWLVDITPAGQSVALTVRSIVIDAYHEETGR